VEIDDVATLAATLDGVRRSVKEGYAEWRYHGRLVARQLHDGYVVIRCDLASRDSLLQTCPGTFSHPPRYRKHMMIVADLARGDPGAIEDAIEGAWVLQAHQRPTGCELRNGQPDRTGRCAGRSSAGGSVSNRQLLEFDVQALFDAMNVQRAARGLTWRGVADELWRQSADLNDRRKDHPISPTTLTGMPKRGDTSCQHALFMLRWLGRSPESFLAGGTVHYETDFPPVGPDRRLRWSLRRLYEALDSRRREERLTWAELASMLGCTPSQLTGIRTARFAMSMQLAMKIVQWLDRPAADFVYAAKW